MYEVYLVSSLRPIYLFLAPCFYIYSTLDSMPSPSPSQIPLDTHGICSFAFVFFTYCFLVYPACVCVCVGFVQLSGFFLFFLSFSLHLFLLFLYLGFLLFIQLCSMLHRILPIQLYSSVPFEHILVSTTVFFPFLLAICYLNDERLFFSLITAM